MILYEMNEFAHDEQPAGYVAGNMAADAHRLGRAGWLVGVFFSDDAVESVRTSEDLEVKYWSYKRGGGQSHTAKSSATVEWSVILAGKVRAKLGEEHVVLQAGDYVLIHPGTPNNLVDEVLEDTVALTIKSPSNPAAKTVLPS